MRRRGFVRIPAGFSAVPSNLEPIVRLGVKGFNSVTLDSFAGNYAAGWQYFDLTGAYCCEVDMTAQGSVTGDTMNLTGLVTASKS